MRPRHHPPLAIVAALAMLLAGCSSNADRGSNQGSGFDGAAFPPSVRAHDFTLSDQHGSSTTLSAYRGQVVALTFLSSDCRACTLVAQQVRGALDELGPTARVTAIFVSTDPRLDTSTSVRRFLRDTSLTGRAEYLNGTEKQLEPVWNAYRVTPMSAGRRASETTTTVLLIDRHGQERVGFGLEQLTPEGLSHDIRRLQSG